MKRGPKPRPPGTTTSGGNRRNISFAKVDADALCAFQAKLSERLGVELTLSQSLRWLLGNAERLLQQEKQR